MSYCLNPDCRYPQNPIENQFCQRCGSRLLLQNRYRTLKLIGQGGFGRTFLAVDEHQPTKPRCVIKQFFPVGVNLVPAQDTSNTTQKAAELFAQEALRLEMLGKHPQIPQFIAHFEQDNRQYLVQEFIEGQNLAQILNVEGAFNEQQIRDLLNSLLPVVEYIHTHNIIHRDIKPENIIRRTSPDKGGADLVLVDFGAAKYATGTALVKTGTVIGSAGYAAPEQASGKAAFSSDLYSLGVTCLHLLTQVEPFDLYSFSEATWVWRDYLKHRISRQLGYILSKMVEMATNRRYQSAADVLNALNSPPRLRAKQPRTRSKSSAQFLQAASPKVTPTAMAVQNWRCVDQLRSHNSAIRSLAITPNGQILASASDDKTIKLWQIGTGRELFTLRGHTKPVYSVAISPDGQFLASGSDDKTIKLWQINTGLQIGNLTLGNWFSGDSGCVYAVAISPDGKILASLSSSGTIQLWNLKTGGEIRTLTEDTSWHHAIAFSPDGQTLAAASDDGTIKLWELRTGRRRCTLKGHASWIRTLAFSPDGRILASGGDDATVKLWDLKTRRLLYTLKGHTQLVYSVALSQIRCAGHRSQEAVEELDFSVNTNKKAANRFQQTQALNVGQILATSSADQTIKLWDITTGQELCTLIGHTSWVYALAISPRGQTLVSGGGDNLINIWQCK